MDSTSTAVSVQPDSKSLASLDAIQIREMIQAIPAKKRAVISKALLAAAQHIKDSQGNYDKAFEFAGLVVENEWLLGQDLEKMAAAGLLKIDTGPIGKKNDQLQYSDLGLSRQRANTARRIRTRFERDDLDEWVKGQYDDETKKLPRVSAFASEARKKDKAKTLDALRDSETEPPDGIYDVIVIDPPWPMEKIEREVAPEQVAFDYPTMEEDELAAMEIPAADDCHLWVWTTHKFLPMALRLLERWSFKYVCTFVWHKPGGFQPFGLPQYNCEFAIYARKGSPLFADATDFNVCFSAARSGHSEKPEMFYDTVRRVTAGHRLDMFNRRAIKGFDGWGNESPAA
jgi:N6-adenosine-specific RNA methylase IME4